MKKVDVYIEICREGVQIPEYANITDAGMDIRATEDVTIGVGCTEILPTGIKVAIPEGYEIQVRPRSGLSFNTPLRVANSPGTIDSGFRNEIGIIVTNTSNYDLQPPFLHTLKDKGNLHGDYLIKKGDRIAQIVLQEVPHINFVVVDNVKDIGTDRGGGFGSTGIK